MNYRTPGVYVEEVSLLPPSVAQVETAIPAFIGYTEKAEDAKGNSLVQQAVRITSMLEYRHQFGGAPRQNATVVLREDKTLQSLTLAENANSFKYRMYFALQSFFDNGGGPCYIFSLATGYPASDQKNKDGQYTDPALPTSALEVIRKIDEITLLVLPDLALLTAPKFIVVQQKVLAQCAALGDRFAILDLKTEGVAATDPVKYFRDNIGTSDLKYGAAYYPALQTIYNYRVEDGNLTFEHKVTDTGGGGGLVSGAFDGLRYDHIKALLADSTDADALTGLNDAANNADFKNLDANGKVAELKKVFTDAFDKELYRLVNQRTVALLPSAAVAGVYARVDRTRGVWKAPANVSLNGVIGPVLKITSAEQQDLNVPDNGKAINAIRAFTGKGILVWGGRTLAGNDNEWRYVSVRRFFNMVEESVKKASEQFVFEPNDANTWIKVKAMIENYLTILWRQGALMGAKTNEAFFVKVGLGETMTQDDVLNGRMIVEIGLAAVRPAEFIILRFSHKMMES